MANDRAWPFDDDDPPSGSVRPHHLYHLKFLLPFFSEVPVLRITKSLADEFRKRRHAGKTIKDATINRDLSTLLWATSLLIATCASPELLTGTWLVVAWSIAATVLAAIAAGAGEARLLLASLALLGFGLCHTLVLEAPTSDLFVAIGHPGSGVPALLVLAAASAAVSLIQC